MTPVTISSLATIIFAAIIHASFQLSVSVLTLLSGHSIGKKNRPEKNFSYEQQFCTWSRNDYLVTYQLNFLFLITIHPPRHQRRAACCRRLFRDDVWLRNRNLGILLSTTTGNFIMASTQFCGIFKQAHQKNQKFHRKLCSRNN